ncbi:MAG: type II toxin-antitoxin system VapC family toxin [Bacillota bacterium]
MILFDTNVLVYAVDLDAPQHPASRALVEAVAEGRIKGALVLQILLEFYAVVTDRRRVRQPLQPEEAWEQVVSLSDIFQVLDAGPRVFEHLKTLVAASRVKGGDIFDAYLVAQMKALEISLLCTYNTRDFTGYDGVIARTPEEILGRN